jgi:hypothetical protein
MRLYVCAFAALLGCSDWTPVKSARDAEGQLVRVQEPGKETVVIDEVVLCDTSGFVFSGDSRDCQETTYDTRRDKVWKHDKDTKGTVGLVVTGILTAIFVPAAVVGSAILASK